MNAAHRPTGTEQDHDTVRNTARTLYKEAFTFAVQSFQDKKAKVRDRLLAAAIIQRAAEWEGEARAN